MLTKHDFFFSDKFKTVILCEIRRLLGVKLEKRRKTFSDITNILHLYFSPLMQVGRDENEKTRNMPLLFSLLLFRVREKSNSKNQFEKGLASCEEERRNLCPFGNHRRSGVFNACFLRQLDTVQPDSSPRAALRMLPFFPPLGGREGGFILLFLFFFFVPLFVPFAAPFFPPHLPLSPPYILPLFVSSPPQ